MIAHAVVSSHCVYNLYFGKKQKAEKKNQEASGNITHMESSQVLASDLNKQTNKKKIIQVSQILIEWYFWIITK